MRNSHLLVITLLLASCSLATKVPPVANAGPDVTIHVGQPILLDGSLSYDPDGGDSQLRLVGRRDPRRAGERRGEML
ncbi:MAG TPA: hypothetical protein DCP08_06980 [Chloroflexi bacterium]|nr:hypothetical protein [Chloroflexota bacterium]